MMEINYIIAKFLQFIQIPQIHASHIDKSSKVRFRSLVVGCNIDRNTYISENSTVLYCDIGAFTSIASDCFIGGARHPIEWVSTSPVFERQRSVLKKKYSRLDYETYKRTIIGNDVWIGTNCLIKGGVTISDGAVIGMGSVVTHDVGPYEIWAGNPARLIRKRFEDNTIKNLMNLKWWKMNENELMEYAELFDDPKKFVEAINGKT